MSLAYGTVMYVWMMEHCDGEFWSFFIQLSNLFYSMLFSSRSNQDCAWSLSSLQLWVLGLDDCLDRLPRPWLERHAGCGSFISFDTTAIDTLFNILCFDVVINRIVPQLIFSVPLVLLYSAYWVFPESSRWLLANGRVEEAEDIVREIARCETNERNLN